MKLTAVGSGYFRVFKDGVEVSKHTSEREAIEKAFQVESLEPSANVTYKHDYEVKVETDAIPAPAPAPPPIAETTGTTGIIHLYSPTSYANKLLTNEPVAVNSATLVSALWNDIVTYGGAGINVLDDSRPIYFVDENAPKKKIRITSQWAYNQQNALILNAGIPMPSTFVISGGTDNHLCIVVTRNGVPIREFDFWRMAPSTDPNFDYEAKESGILDNVMVSDGTLDRRADWNTATASHIPLCVGTGRINPADKTVHWNQCVALAIKRPAPYPTFKFPAKSAPDGVTGGIIPYGQRFKFPANIVIDPVWKPVTKKLVTAIRDRGMVIVDKSGSGATFYIEDPRQYGMGAYVKPAWADWNIEDVLVPLYDGKMPYKIFGDKNNTPEFPWLKLEAIA